METLQQQNNDARRYLPQFIGGQVHSVEVAQHVTSMDIFGDQLELTERSLGVGVVLQIGQRNLKHAALQTVRGNPGALGAVNQGLSDLPVREHVRGLHIVPILAGERIHNLLFRSFFASFGGTLIFADRHDYTSRSKRTETLDV